MISLPQLDIFTADSVLERIVRQRLKHTNSRRHSTARGATSGRAKSGRRGRVLVVSWIARANPEEFRQVRSLANRDAYHLLFQEKKASAPVERLDALGILRNLRHWHVHSVASRGDEKLCVDRCIKAWSRSGLQTAILDAEFYDRELLVVSTSFEKLVIKVDQLAPLAGHSSASLRQFEIDPDGSFVYWPRLDVHLGWESFEHAVDPRKALRAKQQSRNFNRRYGAAIRNMREEAGLRQRDIPGIDSRQVRRIELGQCRATPSALDSLARAHGLGVEDYLNALAERLHTDGVGK